MLYRQKSAMVTLIAILLVWGAYGVLIFSDPPSNGTEMVTALALVGIAYVLVVGAGHLAIAVQHRRRELIDERDQEIERTSRAEAYHGLTLGGIAVFVLCVFDAPPLLIANAVLLASAFGEIVRLSVLLRLYARSA